LSWNIILQIVLSILASIGGIGFVVIVVIKFCSNIIADKLSKKYELRLNKELENFKNKLDKINFITKTRFDTEFSIYRELSRSFFVMAKAISVMIPDGLAKVPVDENEQKEYEKQVYSDARLCVVSAQDALCQNAPFIPISFFEQFNQILELCRKQIVVFDYFFSSKDSKYLEFEDYKRTTEIKEKLNVLNDSIRTHLSALEIIN
jgi:hypothetical protein